MRVGWALNSAEQQFQYLVEKHQSPHKYQTSQIHVMFVTRELNRRVSELNLGAAFRRYGNLVDIVIKKNAVYSIRIGIQMFFIFLLIYFLVNRSYTIRICASH